MITAIVSVIGVVNADLWPLEGTEVTYSKLFTSETNVFIGAEVGTNSEGKSTELKLYLDTSLSRTMIMSKDCMNRSTQRCDVKTYYDFEKSTLLDDPVETETLQLFWPNENKSIRTNDITMKRV